MNSSSTPSTPQPNPLLYGIIFLLSLVEFLQSGMTAFAAAPIMGEVSIGPEEFSLIAAVYASFAVFSISMQRWFVERIGGRSFIQLSALVSVAGSLTSACSHDFVGLLIGRALMALGGGSFFTASRMIIHHTLAGPKRFVGIRSLAMGVALGVAAAPWLASVAVSNDSWAAMYVLTATLSGAIFLMASFCLPKAPINRSPSNSDLSPWHQVLLLASIFMVLYALQRFYYDFYGNVILCGLVFIGGLTGVWIYLHRQHVHAKPLLRIRGTLRPRFLFGLGLFLFAYLMLGANNYEIPSMLQGTLGYGWATVGRIEALGFFVTMLTWWVMERVLPRHPAPRKFLVVGFAALAAFGGLLMRITPNANLWIDVLPALACNSIFLLTVLPVNAMQAFREMEHDEAVLSNAQQLKNMMAQVGIALGVALATIGQQWRVAVHYSVLSQQLAVHNPAYVETIQRLQDYLSSMLAPSEAGKLAVAQASQMLAQQSAMLANLDHFSVIAGLGLLGIAVVMTQRVFR
ncbi:MFS transporter [Paucibacter sp. R3-3]|uniref:MFS transporter n=1 Tax=Roseateles agri TaxID=3098619 RepID=A0ABU5DUF8_9BURK|nr:MFS transporter [Paucibacter sp. R3-3]MDY0749067.1 MFS transporter [Paucibacter sp. R3-3]